MMQSAPIRRAADGFDQVLRNQGVDRRNSGDINDGDFCPDLTIWFSKWPSLTA